MRHRLILHIGSPKTGTTAIQQFLYENQAFLEENGFSYPWIQKEMFFPINASAFCYYMKKGFSYPWLQKEMLFPVNGAESYDYINNEIVDIESMEWQNFWEKVREKLRKNHVILSWEGIFHYNMEAFFTAVKKEYDNINVVIYLRRQDRYIESYWNQMVKRDHICTVCFPQVIDSHVFYIDYKARLDTIARIIGKENLIVRVYEKGQFQGQRQDVISDFLDALQIEPDWNRCIISQHNNSALFGNYIEIKRRMNFYFRPTKSVFDIELVLSRYLFYRKNVPGIRNSEGMFTSEERQTFLKQFEEENAAIARQYLGREDGILFCDQQPIPVCEIDHSTLCDDIKGMFAFLFENWKKCMRVRCVDSSSLAHSFEYVDFTQRQLIKQLDEIQEQALPKDKFELQCFSLVEKYTPFLVKLYDDKSEIYQTIPKYFQERSKGKKLFFLGTGDYCQYLLSEIDLLPDAFLDNNPDKNDKEFFGAKVLNPFHIRDWSHCFVVITVKKPDVIAAMEQQLQGYGLKKDVDYLVGPEYFMDPF